jgi:hypothetical protein
MTFYRLHHRSLRNGRIRAIEEIEAASDIEAARLAARRAGRRPAELWREDRLIRSFGAIRLRRRV